MCSYPAGKIAAHAPWERVLLLESFGFEQDIPDRKFVRNGQHIEHSCCEEHLLTTRQSAVNCAAGEGVLKQWAEEPTGIAAAFVIFMAASLVPLVQPNGQGQELGPFTAKAEMLNGRAAMIGFAALLVIEVVKGSPLF